MVRNAFTLNRIAFSLSFLCCCCSSAATAAVIITTSDLLASLLIFCVAVSSLGRGDSQSTINVVDFGATGDGKSDDTQAFSNAWNALCGAEAEDAPTLEIPMGKSFLLQSVIFRGPCKFNSVHVQVLGNIAAPNGVDKWTKSDSDCWLWFYDVNGLIIDGSGTIDGQGSAWWGQALCFHNCNNLQLSGLTHLNSPRNHITVNGCNGVSISNINVIAPEESPNTDGIDISFSSQVNIYESFIGTGDDCVAINGNCSYINITNVVCGPGHGISVGSLGDDGAYDKVEEVHVSHCTFNGTQNGARIKTWPGGLGYARRITFEKITLIAAKNPIIIDQHYRDDSLSGLQESAVVVSDVTYNGFQGTSAYKLAITLNCSEVGCTKIVMDRVNITSSMPGSEIYAYCNNAHGTSSSTAPNVPCLTG